jgi:protein-S-isoprenylcysteine O-methyltransferase Ste14
LGAVGYAVPAAAATCLWPAVCLMRSLPCAAVFVVGAVLLAIGIPLWLAGVVAAMRAYNKDALVTSGVFGMVRHPIYSAWIVFNIPAIAVLCRSWPLLGTAVVTYVVFKFAIRREDEYLEQRFGQAYRDYRSRVNEIVPMPKFGWALP